MSAPQPRNPFASPAAAPGARTTAERKLLAALLVGLALWLFLPAGWRTLWSPDEGRYAEIPREMVASGDWVTPRLDGVKYFEKPPLFYWSAALAIAAFGVDERALRAVPALFALLGAAATILAARRLWGTHAAFMAGVALGTMPLYFGIANLLAIDMAVSALITVTLLAFLAAAQSTGRRRDLWLGAFYGAAALATLAKGLIGIAIPGMVILAWLSLTGRWRDLTRYRMVFGTLLFLVIAGPWHWMVQARNPEWAWFYFVHEHFLRYTTTLHKRSEPFWFYLPVVIFGAFPWSAMIPAAALRWWRERRSATDRAQWDAGLFCVVWFVVVLGFFSLAGSKLPTYVVPALPPLALLLAADAARGNGLGRGAAWIVAATCALVAIAIAAVPWFAESRASLQLAVSLLGIWRWLLALSFVGVGAAALVSWQKPEFTRRLAGSTALMLLVLAGAATKYNDERSVKSLAAVLAPRLSASDLVAAYHCYPQDLAPYLGRRVAIAGWIGELEFGASVEDQSAWLLDQDAFQRRWNGQGIVYVVAEPKDFPGLQAASTRPPRVLAQTRKYVLAVNQPAPGPGAAP